jgi:ribonucleoside-diphosphate reductase beta chain
MSFIKNSGSDRYTIFPINYPGLWKFYEDHLASFWTVNEIKLSDDLVDWNSKLNDNERFFIKNILAFFASSDGMVNENLVLNFYNEVQIPEARSFYTIQMMMETIHSQQYALLIDTYITNTEEKKHLFNAMETIPAIKKKADWILKWIEEGSTIIDTLPPNIVADITALHNINNSALSKDTFDFFIKKRPSFQQRLIAFICVEGIFFSGAFCAIYWLKNRGLMPGLATANEFISRDENLHASFAISLFKMDSSSISEETVHNIFREAVSIEQEFITESLPVSLIGMNCKLMSEYIEYVADRWCVLLGYSRIYNTENPFSFMEMISLSTKENFFELNVSQYSRSGVGIPEEKMKITFDEDF